MGGKKAGEGRVEQTEPLIFSADETCDVGSEAGSPVTYGYLCLLKTSSTVCQDVSERRRARIRDNHPQVDDRVPLL